MRPLIEHFPADLELWNYDLTCPNVRLAEPVHCCYDGLKSSEFISFDL